MSKDTVSLSGLPGLCEDGQSGHIADAGIEFPANFSEEQKIALEALVGGFSVVAAARAAGVHRGTVGRWLRKEEFSGLVEQERDLQGLEREIRRERLTLYGVKALENGVKNGDLYSSIAVLEFFGLLEPGAADRFALEGKERVATR